MRIICPDKCTDRDGATLIEFALTLPIVLIIFFAALELTWLNMVRHTVKNAAYESARKAALPNSTEDDVLAEAMSLLEPLGMDENATCVMSEGENLVTVTVSVPLRDNNWGISTYTNNMTLTKTVTLSRE